MTTHHDRRSFLRLLAYGTAGVAGTRLLSSCSGNADDRAGQDSASTPIADMDKRVLVVVELSGGNDGPSTIVPHTNTTYYSLRPNMAVPADQVLQIDNTVGFHPNLKRTEARGAAVVEGVGTTSPDFSHFEMLARWWAADPDGTERPRTGFLGRLCDQLDTGAVLTGVSLGGGMSPALLSDKARTAGLGELETAWYLSEQDPSAQILAKAVETMGVAQDNDSALLGKARAGLNDALDIADLLTSLPVQDSEVAESELGFGLAFASRLIEAEQGVRIIHVPAGGDFDTHDGHAERHSFLMEDLDTALDTFLTGLETKGLADRVLITTTSEFGRRVPENGSGLDHGAASVALLMGPVNTGRFGEYPSFDDLDEGDNLVATVDVNDYYATIAEEWFGISAPDVLSGSATPLDGVIS